MQHGLAMFAIGLQLVNSCDVATLLLAQSIDGDGGAMYVQCSAICNFLSLCTALAYAPSALYIIVLYR